MSILPQGDRIAVAVTSAGPAIASDSRRRSVERAVVYLSGPAAEGRFVDVVSSSCADSDAFSARLQLAGAEGENLDRRVAAAQRWAKALVERWGPDIERLADALLARKKLTGDEVIELFGARREDQS
jgi:hypothetical protein